jgi:hypothetical protein
MADQNIINDIAKSIDSINFGSVEIIVQNGEVTQISTRMIKKTNVKNAGKITGQVAKTSTSINFKY